MAEPGPAVATSGPLPIALVIASHRRGARIGPTLESVLRQTVTPAEVIVFNDGGAADTRDFASAAYPNVIVVDGVGGCPAASRNRGAAQATQPYVMFLDDDDVLHAHAVETLWRTLTTFDAAKAAFADHTFSDAAAGVRIENHHRTLPSFRRLDEAPLLAQAHGVRLFGRGLYYPMLSGGLLQQPWLIERAVFEQLGGFDESFRSNEDWELFLRLAYTHALALTDEVISDHIVEADRQHVSRSVSLDETGRAIVEKHLRLAREHRDRRASWALRQRLGRMYKTEGDRLAASDVRAAWRRYCAALRMWPLDHVVVARALFTLPVQLLLRRP